MSYRGPNGQYVTKAAARRRPRTTAKVQTRKARWPRRVVVFRRVDTGKFVSPAYAAKHPATTMSHRRRR